jgi:hypothetical protein
MEIVASSSSEDMSGMRGVDLDGSWICAGIQTLSELNRDG